MINFSDITKAVEEILIHGLKQKSADYRVKRSAYINMDHSLTPWVGIYRGTLEYNPATLGSDLNSWKGLLKLRLVVQSSSGSDNGGEQAEERLEEYVQDVLNVMLADKQWGNTVAMVVGISIEYSYNETESESLYFQEAHITLDAEVRTQ